MNIKTGTNEEVRVNQSNHAYSRKLDFRHDTPVKGYYYITAAVRDTTSPIKNAALATAHWVSNLNEDFLNNAPVKIQLSYLFNFPSTSEHKHRDIAILIGNILVIRDIVKGQATYQGSVYHPYIVDWDVIAVEYYDEGAQNALNDTLIDEYNSLDGFDSSDFMDSDNLDS